MDNQTTKAGGIMGAATSATQWPSLAFISLSVLTFFYLLSHFNSPIRDYPGPFLASEWSSVAVQSQHLWWLMLIKNTRTCGELGTLLAATSIWYIRNFTKSTAPSCASGLTF